MFTLSGRSGRLSGRPAAEVERREILVEGLIYMGSRALHDRLEHAIDRSDFERRLRVVRQRI